MGNRIRLHLNLQQSHLREHPKLPSCLTAEFAAQALSRRQALCALVSAGLTLGVPASAFAESEPNSIGRKTVVLGVGGMGDNVVRQMVCRGVHGLEFASIRRTKESVARISIAPEIVLGWDLEHVARTPRGAAEHEIDRIRSLMCGVDVLVIVAAMNGTAGGPIAPVVARVAKQSGIYTLGAVTKPAEWEGSVHSRLSELNASALSPYLDGLVTLDQERLFDDPLVEEMEYEEFLAHSNSALIDAIEASLRVIPKSIDKNALRRLPLTKPAEDMAAVDDYNRRFREARRGRRIG